jgi:hypothetical protein
MTLEESAVYAEIIEVLKRIADALEALNERLENEAAEERDK